MTARSLNAFYVHANELGYGRMGIELTKALTRRGVELYDRMPGTIPTDFHVLNQGKREGLCATCCWFSYPSHAPGWYAGQYAACMTMWETAMLPEAFRGVLDNFDLLIVPSVQNQELFGEWHPNVKYVPLGIDPDWWVPTRRTEPGRHFRFLTSGGGPRKGGDLVREAFFKCFPDGSWGDGPIPVLQVKSIKGGVRSGPRLEVITGRITAEEERNLYAQAHVYVQPSRGEGFGLQPLQAIAQACPTILTDAHGHTAFAALGMPLSATTVHNSVAGGYFSFGESGDWWEPNFDELCDWMLYCYDNYDAAQDDAWQNAQVAHTVFTWDETARKFIDAFPKGQLSAPAPEPVGFRKLQQRLYRVRVEQTRQMDIAGIVHRFEPGRDYWECADLKRLLFDASWLTADCLFDNDAGLTESQVARLPEYSAAKSFCPHCHQQLNSGVYRDELEAV